MTGWNSFSESHSLRGAIDRTALLVFRDTVERHEPLASGQFDDFYDPSVLEIELDDGIGPSTGGRFDVRWSTTDDYNIHYSSGAGPDFRWDAHYHAYPNPSGDEHFHPPPDASKDPPDVAESCMSQPQPELVAVATVQSWRRCYEKGSLSDPNGLTDPP